MSLDKAIAHQKEYRKPYHGAKAVDPNCRNHGSCAHCQSNRKYKYIKAEQAAKEMLTFADKWRYTISRKEH